MSAPTRPATDAEEGPEAKESQGQAQAAEQDDAEEETCGFCKFMKGGPCGDVFVAWESCVDSERKAGNDFVESCLVPTKALKECMEANPEYYGPLLEAEKEDIAAMDDEEAPAAAATASPKPSK